jgi:hypothetical protein
MELDRVFTQDIFDFKTELALMPNGHWAEPGDSGATTHKFEIRSRFHDTLTAPYWRALWRTLPDPATVENGRIANAIRRYNKASEPGAFRGYLIERAHALRWIEDAIIFKNAEIAKPLLLIRDLAQFRLGVNNTAEAAIDFLRLDHHVAFTDWIASHLVPPSYRLSAGRTLPISDVRCTARNVLTARIDMSGYDLTIDSLQSICTIQAGAFVRFTPCDEDKTRGQTVGQLLRLGSTCVVNQIEWATGEVVLSVVVNPTSDSYRLMSRPYQEIGEQWQCGTLDESPTDFVAGRVERRLSALGGHQVCNWLNPTRPEIPAAAQVDADTMRLLARVADAVVLPSGRPLAPEQREAALAGVSARVQLLQGPPGTGKTVTTAAATLLRIAARRHPGDLVLIAANTHTAVNNLLDRIAQLLPDFIVKAKQLGVQMPTVRLAKLESSEDGTPPSEPMDSINAGSIGVRAMEQRRAGAVSILGGTTGALLKLAMRMDETAAYGRRAGGFQAALLVVDEASMMVFPDFLAIGTMLAPDGEIMATGDHRQLSPIVAHDWETEERPPVVLYQPYVSAYNAIRNIGITGRVPRQSLLLSALRYSFRLPALIRELVARLYRRDDIELDGRAGGDRGQHLPESAVWERLWADQGGLFLVVHDERRSTHSNEVECRVIRAILEAADSLPNDSVAVVTPHRAQRNLLYRLLEEYVGAGRPVGVIDTVERLQGGERPTIFVSATESDPASIAARAEFILSLNRANVAFTRAEDRLIVVCARTLLDHIPSEIENYDSTMLWKSMRAFCSESLGTATISGHRVTVYTPPREAIIGERVTRPVAAPFDAEPRTAL